MIRISYLIFDYRTWSYFRYGGSFARRDDDRVVLAISDETRVDDARDVLEADGRLQTGGQDHFTLARFGRPEEFPVFGHLQVAVQRHDVQLVLELLFAAQDVAHFHDFVIAG